MTCVMALPSLWPGAEAVLVQRAKPVPNFHGRALLSQGLRASCAHLSRVCLWIMSGMYLGGVPCLCVWGQTARFADSLSMSVHHRMSTSSVCGGALLPRMRKRRVLTWGPGMQTDPGWHGTCLSVPAGGHVMQWKLCLLLAWLVIGSGGCRTGVLLQTVALARLCRRRVRKCPSPVHPYGMMGARSGCTMCPPHR